MNGLPDTSEAWFDATAIKADELLRTEVGGFHVGSRLKPQIEAE